MTTYTSEPGTRLGGRYRLESRIAAGAGWAAWKAIDEVLARAVTVFTFASGFPRVTDVVTAARAASRLTDPRLAQVFDVEDAWDGAYIVMEWAAGETLGDMLTGGPLEPFRAARIVAESAAALAVAHVAGIAHMCLSPGSVRWSPTGEVKVVGLGIDAALSGIGADQPALADTMGLGRLLYAGLTAHWPGSEFPSLPPAPVSGGRPVSPRQVVAGVPPALSDLTLRAMQLEPGPAALPLTTPAELARALHAVLPPAPVPAALIGGTAPARRDQTARYPSGASQAEGGRARAPQADRPAAGRRHAAAQMRPGPSGTGYTGDTWPPDWDGQQADEPRPDRRPAEHRRAGGRGAGRRRMPSGMPARLSKGVVIGIAGVVAVIAIAAFTLWPGGGSPGGGSPNSQPTTPVATSVTVLHPVGATGFDPLTSPAKDPGDEMSSLAKYAIDPSPRTAWVSQWYYTPKFGDLKTGSGLIIDMGKPVRFSSVTVTFGSSPGADVELLTGNSDARSQANLASMTQIASATGLAGTHSFHITNSTAGRYLVIWFTSLPPLPGHHGRFAAEVFNVEIKGSS